MLGVGFKPRFISRFCIPLTVDPQSTVSSGFNSAPASRSVPHGHVLQAGTSVDRPAPMSARSMIARGMYRLRYILEPRVSVHPRSFSCSVPQDGPYEIANMWTNRPFHHSLL